MNRLILFMACGLLSFLSALAQNTVLKLKLTGVEDGSKFCIQVGATHQDEDVIQTVEVKDGSATFAFDSEGPRLYLVRMPEAYGAGAVVLDKGDNATLMADLSFTEDERRRFCTFNNQKVEGSAQHDEFLKRNVNRGELDKKYQKYHDDNKAVLDKLNAIDRKTNPEAFRAICETPEYKKFAEDEKAFFDGVAKAYNDAFLANKDSWFGPLLMLYNMSYLSAEQGEIFSQFSKEVQESFYGKIAHDKIFPPSLVGKQMPDFQFTDYATKKKMSLYEQVKAHKYVLLDFWASWCGPCRKEIPNFKKQYELYKDKGLQVVSISADAKEADWVKALNEEKLEWPNDRDGEQGICKLYKVQYYPTVYLLDSEGKVVAKDNDARGEKLAKLLEGLFRE